MVHKILFLAVLTLAVFRVTAQEFYKSYNPLTTEANSLNYKLTGQQYYFSSTLQGTVYLYDGWKEGSVILENGDRYDHVLLKLNTFTEDLVWFNSRTGTVAILDKFIIREFFLDSTNSNTGLFRKIYYDQSPKIEHYYNVVYDGKIKLLFWHKTEEVNTPVYPDELGYLRNTEFKMYTEIFFVFPDNSMVKIKGTRKSFVNLFPDKKKAVRQLFRKNKIVLWGKNKTEIARAVKLIETNFFMD